MSAKRLPEQYGEHFTSDRESTNTGMFYRRGWKEFTVHINGEVIQQYRGQGITLDDVICRREVLLQRDWKEAKNHGTNWLNFLGDRGDEVVWRGDEVAAVLLPKRPHKIGNITLIVYRFDQTAEKDAGRIEAVPREKKTADKSAPKRVRKSRAKPVVSRDDE